LNELAEVAKKIRNPFDLQRLLYRLDYLCADTMKSALSVWNTGSAHCLESVHLAAALMEHKGFPPLALSLDSADNICHVVYVFRGPRGWGAVGRSKEPGLHGRAPVFRSIKDLAWSYFDPYVDDTGLLTGYALVHLDDCGSDWRLSRRNVWASERHILSTPHVKLRASPRRYRRALAAFQNGGHRPQLSWW
jgi:hypothetical protein